MGQVRDEILPPFVQAGIRTGHTADRMLTAALRALWLSRAPRERRVLAVALGLIAAIADAHSLEAAGDKILRPLADGSLGSADAPWSGLIALDGNLTTQLLADIAASPLFAAADLPRFTHRPDVAAYVGKYVDAARDYAQRPVGRLGGPVARGEVAGIGNQGGSLGNLIADAQLAATAAGLEFALPTREVAPTVYFNVPKGFDLLIPLLEEDDALRAHFFSKCSFAFYAAASLPTNQWDRFLALAARERGGERDDGVFNTHDDQSP